MSVEKYDTVARIMLPRPILWLSILSTAGLGLFMVTGVLSMLRHKANHDLATLVMAAMGGVSFLMLSSILIVTSVHRPTRSVEKILAGMGARSGLYMNGSRRAVLTVTIAASWFALTSLAGALFARGGLQVALIVLAGLVGMAAVAGVTASSRPRFLWLRAEEFESSTQRSHATVAWADVRSLGINMGGAGDLVLTVFLKEGAANSTVHWRNRWMPGRHDVEVDLASLGLQSDAVASLMATLLNSPQRRSLLETHRNQLAPLLLDKNAPWPDGNPGRNRPY